MAVQYGQLSADYACGRISREEFERIDKEQGIATAEVVSSILGVAGVIQNVAVEGASKGYQPPTNPVRFRTYFKPDPAQHGLKDNMEYFKRALE